MALTTTTNGANTTVTLTRTAPNAKMNAVLTDAAHYFWKGTDAEWTAATNAQKLAVLETALVSAVTDAAKTYNMQSGLATTRTTKNTENTNNYEF